MVSPVPSSHPCLSPSCHLVTEKEAPVDAWVLPGYLKGGRGSD